MSRNAQPYTGWAYITRAEDLENSWVAHCLDFDVMSVGDSPQHALEMVREAVGICLADDLNRGFDPRSRKADEEAWQPLLRLFEKHTKVPASEMNAHENFKEFAVPLTVVLVREAHDSVSAMPAVNPHTDDMAHAPAAA